MEHILNSYQEKAIPRVRQGRGAKEVAAQDQEDICEHPAGKPAVREVHNRHDGAHGYQVHEPVLRAG